MSYNIPITIAIISLGISLISIAVALLTFWYNTYPNVYPKMEREFLFFEDDPDERGMPYLSLFLVNAGPGVAKNVRYEVNYKRIKLSRDKKKPGMLFLIAPQDKIKVLDKFIPESFGEEDIQENRISVTISYERAVLNRIGSGRKERQFHFLGDGSNMD